MSEAVPSTIVDINSELKLKGFKAYKADSEASLVHSYNRKDFYKISLNTGKFIIHYADRTSETDEPMLFFANPHIPYSCEIASPTHSGYACLFTEEFLKLGERSESLQQSPLFKVGGTPVLTLTQEQKKAIQPLFEKIIAEQETDYPFKDELIRNYISLVIHEALKIQPAENLSKHKNAAERIASVFLDLLERQFPIESVDNPLELKTAQDFAKSLSVHVNYLNRSVKEITGKTTTVHIAERIVTEAKALLQHTEWNSADIAYALGFEYPTYFNNFFKKMTGTNPRSLRSQEV